DSAHPLVPGLAAWGTSPEPAGVFNSPPLLMATPFTPSTLSAAEVTSLTTQCHHLHSTPHLCPSCAAPSPHVPQDEHTPIALQRHVSGCTMARVQRPLVPTAPNDLPGSQRDGHQVVHPRARLP